MHTIMGLNHPQQLAGMNEAAEGLMEYQGSARGLLGRPAVAQAPQDLLAQARVPVQYGTAPAPGPSLLLGIAGAVPLGLAYPLVLIESNWLAVASGLRPRTGVRGDVLWPE